MEKVALKLKNLHISRVSGYTVAYSFNISVCHGVCGEMKTNLEEMLTKKYLVCGGYIQNGSFVLHVDIRNQYTIMCCMLNV